MKNKIEEDVLHLIDEIDKLMESTGEGGAIGVVNKMIAQRHMPGTSWKTASGKIATKDSAGNTTYRDDSPASNYTALKKDRAKKPAGWKSASDPSYRKTNEAEEFPNGSLSIIGSSKKPKNKKRKSKNEALDADSSGHITPDELKKQLDVSKAQLAAAKAGSKLAQSLPDKIKGQEDKISKLQGKSFTPEPMK